MTNELFRATGDGLYCEAGDFHVDPWRPVPRAVVTHAHADHAVRGCGSYLVAESGRLVLQTRLGAEAPIETLPFGETVSRGGVRLSLHPAGHILGSAQVRVERGGEVWVVSGDYKTAPDATCETFEPLRCHAFVTESTFGLPIYRWPAAAAVFDELRVWLEENERDGRASVIFAYALGKAQRVLAGVGADRPIYCHGAVEALNRAYRESGVALPPTEYAGAAPRDVDWTKGLIVAPPSANGTPWMRKFRDVSTAFVSGWMLVRGARRRRSVDRGFALSDHADWPGLEQAIAATEAERVYVTHGAVRAMVRWLSEQGLDARPLETRYSGEQDDDSESGE